MREANNNQQIQCSEWPFLARKVISKDKFSNFFSILMNFQLVLNQHFPQAARCAANYSEDHQ